jgi:transmembrane sensor
MTRANETDSGTAVAIADRAAEWLLRQDASDWLESDQTELDAWLDESPQHLAAYWRLEAGWARTERLVALKPARMQRPQTVSSKKSRPVLRFGTAAIIVIAMAFAGWYGWTTRQVEYATAIGQRAKILLADGTHIQLNTNSAISVSFGLWQRTVDLKKGEAFFDVHHDAARPFSVLAAGHRVTDLGTKFSVRTFNDRLEVTLVEGRARLEAASPAVQRHATDLEPGEVAVATAGTITVAKVPMRSLANALAWRQGQLAFNHTTLADAAAEFNRYNGTKLVIEPAVANLTVSGVFDAGSVDTFTNMAKFAFKLRVKKQGREVLMSR